MEYNVEETTLAKARRIGGSFVVTIPATIAKAENIQENDLVEIKVKKRRKNYFGVLRGVGSFTKEDRMQDRKL